MVRSRRVSLAVVLVAASAVAASAAPAVHADYQPYPVRHVSITGFDGLSFADPTPDGRFLLIGDCCGTYARVEAATGVAAPIDFDPITMASGHTLSDDGRYGYAVEGDTIQRIDVGSGASTDFTVPFVNDWFLGAVVDGDSSGRVLLVTASSGGFASTRAFLFDTVTQQLITPDPTGVLAAANVAAFSLSDDGRYVDYATFVVGGGWTQVVRWDRTADTRSAIDPPSGFAPALGGWTVSPNHAWALFPGSDAGIVPGLDATPRLYRRDLSTGATTAVPVDWDATQSYSIADTGRVVVVADAPTPDENFADGAFTWDGSGPAVLVSRAADGAPANFGVEGDSVEMTTDGSKVLFTSFAWNLVAGANPTPDTRRLFEVTLPPVGTVNSAAVVAAGERYCVAAVGALPGDFVGVNITPVGAVRPGFGVLHSSDDTAGTTSNVNFAPGSVDPNVAFAQVGADGRICFTNSVHGPVHVILDEMIVADGTAFRAPTAEGSARLADTRIGIGGGILAASETRCLAATGAVAGEYVGVNVLPIEATTPGFGTVHPGGSTPGSSSTANFGPGSFDPNFAFTAVGPDGTICFTNSVHGPVHLILDELIVGSATAMSRPLPGPNSDRPVDTRSNTGGARLAAGGRVCFTIPGSEPGDFGGVNILPVAAAGPGYGALHSSADVAGSTSNVNYGPGSFDPNFAIAQFGNDNQICFTNGPTAATDVIIDSQIIADVAVFTEPTPDGSVRLVDTRIART